MKHLALTALALAIATPAAAQMQITPIAKPKLAEIPLYPAAKDADKEQWEHVSGKYGQIVIDNDTVRNVTRPTITPYLPDPAKATGAAVVVAPGGAFMSLSMSSEGEVIARWLTEQGIAAFVLKYRLNETPRDSKAFMSALGQRMGQAARNLPGADIKEPRATQDALAALALIRTRAKEFRVDPARVGMIGFSAGAMTALNAALEGQGSARPAFIGYIYGPMTTVTVPTDAPPMFAAIAMDDGLFRKQGFAIAEAWRNARRPVELHAYERGDHGFGIGRPGTTTTGLLPQFTDWLRMHGLLTASR
ncbi:alpha/beta hydrolase [Sphingobium sp. EP60837]|uniref:alpha/beta hydrolase n=1 Tax=Sphingobium sp. EP60837 TaxID=1855519 RepID=UPI0007DDB99A|nr:alpha/beta hydrolase [Sphingobium sp. EP60837]ANI79455.1 Endo-1,4-beta-xylanase [Sphingobium sp. EP60837]